NQGPASPAVLPSDPQRRFWLGTACAVGGVAGVATAVPFVASMNPSDRAKAAGAPVEIALGGIAPGTMITAEWQGKPVWLIHRTQPMSDGLPTTDSPLADPKSERRDSTPDFAKYEGRFLKSEWFICVGICTLLGCSSSPRFAIGGAEGMGSGLEGGFLCPC